jgi:glycosyltransferase involved in cell wall biosynthesis
VTKDKLKTLDPSIRVVHQDNKGLSAARNTGFREAKADIVLPLDSDDQLEPTYLEEMLGALQSAPGGVGFAVSHVRQIGAAQAIEKRYVNSFDVLFKNVTGYTLMLRKAAWQAVGGYDETMRDGYEDWEFSLRLITSGVRGVVVDKPIFIYTVSAQGMLMGHSSQRHAALWRRIRVKHRELYRPMNLLRRYWQNRHVHTEISLVSTMAALLLTSILPDKWYSAIVSTMRYRRFKRSNESAAAIVPSAARGR